ncbi:MAG: Uma2 family endonuclease [Tannerella sp.]|jgi:Uma2 family endonuclease|nr:Uma2 family endonuclease [Tannerella sp.]
MELVLDLNKRYSYSDYLTWLDNKRRELIDGFIRMMSPAPHTIHAIVSENIDYLLSHYIRQHKGKCRVFSAPFDVRLPVNGESADKDIFTVVQPDICVVCDMSKIDYRGCLGAPDMIAEILSPSTRRYDLVDKYNLYERSKVKEYWVIDPQGKDVTVYLLQDTGVYAEGIIYEFDASVPVLSLSGLNIELKELFD